MQRQLKMLSKQFLTHKKPFNFGRFFCLCLMLLCLHATSQSKLSIKDAKQNFGMVKKGKLVSLNYLFTNTGNQPLLIYKINVSCSCTTFDYPDLPIAPNQTDTIKIFFDTKSVYDRQDRTVEIISNAKPESQKIRFKGVVIK